MAPPADRIRHLVVGVDFGTTNSGFCYVDVDAARTTSSGVDVALECVNFHGAGQYGQLDESVNYPKVASVVCYATPGELGCSCQPATTRATTTDSEGAEAIGYRWGPQVDIKCPEKCRYFKLCFDYAAGNYRSSRELRPSTRGEVEISQQASGGSSGFPRPPVQIVGDYLKAMRLYFYSQLRERYPGEPVEDFEIDWTFTYPAFFTEVMIAELGGLLVQCGFANPEGSQPSFMLEPSAAIFNVLQIQKMKKESKSRSDWQSENIGPLQASSLTTEEPNPAEIEVGDIVVVCDAGGGTTDLQAFRIDSLGSGEVAQKPKFELSQLFKNKGLLVGSIDVNEEFEKVLKDIRKFVPLEIGGAGQGEEFEREIASARQDFELAKLDFYASGELSDNDVIQMIPFPSLGQASCERANIVCGCYYLTSKIMKLMFQPVLRELLLGLMQYTQELQRSTVSSSEPAAQIKSLVCVGGLCASPYVELRLREWAKEQHYDVITPQTSQDRIAAIMNGATQHRLQHLVTNKPPIKNVIASSDYGFVIDVPYDHEHGVDPGVENPNFYDDEFTGERMTRGHIRWLVKRGESFLAKEDDLGRFGHTAMMRHKVRCAQKPTSLIWKYQVVRTEVPKHNLPNMRRGRESGESNIVDMLTIEIDPKEIDIKRKGRKVMVKRRINANQTNANTANHSWHSRFTRRSRRPNTSKHMLTYYEIDLDLKIILFSGGGVLAEAFVVPEPGYQDQKPSRLKTFLKWIPGKAKGKTAEFRERSRGRFRTAVDGG
ncbi:hypothetical protein DFH27DRAFT_601577 [Peziza echinospora]|nr:hypothetical protein DFH27DRAFT_601577 [Peziza echinospora]